MKRNLHLDTRKKLCLKIKIELKIHINTRKKTQNHSQHVIDNIQEC